MERILTKKPVYVKPKEKIKADAMDMEELDEYFNEKEEWKRKDVIDFLQKKREIINIDTF